MDVYFIPVGRDRYELYCEDLAGAEDTAGEEPPAGRLASLYQKFKAALALVEQERLSGEKPVLERHRSWNERMKDRVLCWIAEKIAEQRLLWRLRNETQIAFFHPDDIPETSAVALARAELQREADRHLKWLIIDGTIFVATGAVALVPGPNILAYYFGFRLVGHYLSRRGAKQGLDKVQWLVCASPALSRLRQAVSLAEPERDREVHEVASVLRLPHLAKFFERTSVKTA